MISARKIVFLFATAGMACLPLSSAIAGFELIAPKPQARVEAPAVAPSQDFRPKEPMQIAPAVPVEPVSVDLLDAPATMSRSYVDQQAEDVYVPRNVAVSSSGSVELFIDPYPLQAQQPAAPANDRQASGMDRAMLKQSGHLQGVASSGNRISMVPANGTLQTISRYDGTSAGEGPAALSRHSGFSSSSQGITPMMGGEVQPLPSPYGQTQEQTPNYPAPVSAEPLTPPSAPMQVAEPVYPRPSPTEFVPRPPEAEPAQTPPYQVMPTAAVPVQGDFPEAVGFGRDLPLALALSQVVPPDYTFSFTSDVDAGENVSWQGGKPWNVVLDEMLASAGMRAAISGNQVVVRKAS